MAKKRKEKKEDEEIDFKLPKFDEKKFITKEIRNIKTLFISFILGLIISMICFGFWILLSESGLRWELVLLLGVFNASWLKYLFIRLNIDLTDFGRKGWFVSYAIYFLTWLIVLIILVNPPIYDDEAPSVELAILPEIQELGGTVKIVAHVIDNIGIEKTGINFTLIDPNGSINKPEFNFVDNIFEYTYENSKNILGDYSFTIKSTDINGHTTDINGVFRYDNNVIILTTPANGSDLHSYTPIEFQINPKVNNPIPFDIGDTKYTMNMRVFYKIDDGLDINISRLDQNNEEIYRSTAEFKGWEKGKNVSLNAFVEVSYYFINIPQKYSNIVKDTKTYFFKTLDIDGENIGLKDTLIPPDPSLKLNNDKQPENSLNYYIHHPRKIAATPGFEIVIFLISLILVAFIFKFRKKDKKK